MRKYFLGLLFLSISAPAIATAQKAEKCTSVDQVFERLSCYDEAYGQTEEAVKEEESKEVDIGLGNWRRQVDTSEMTDQKSIYFSLMSEDTFPTRFGGGKYLTMRMRCQENTTAVNFYFDGEFVADSGGFGKIEYRVDDERMRTRNFVESTSNQHLGLWSGGRSIPFLRQLIRGQKLVVRATPYNANAITVNFDIRGYDTALKELSEMCNWNM